MGCEDANRNINAKILYEDIENRMEEHCEKTCETGNKYENDYCYNCEGERIYCRKCRSIEGRLIVCFTILNVNYYLF